MSNERGGRLPPRRSLTLVSYSMIPITITVTATITITITITSYMTIAINTCLTLHNTY